MMMNDNVDDDAAAADDVWGMRGYIRSPDCLSEGFSIVSAAVGSSPLALDLQTGQGSTMVVRHGGGNKSEQDKHDLHFQDKFQPETKTTIIAPNVYEHNKLGK